jgi:Tol biopolymer transport system component
VPLDGSPPIKSEIDPVVQSQLKEADVHFTNFRWSPTGRAILFEGVSRHVRNLWRVEVDASTLRWVGGPERLTTGVGLDTDITISQDGTRLAFTSRIEQSRIWSLPFDASSSRMRGQGQPISAAGMSSTFPDLSPTGEKLVFLAHRAGKEELWEKSLQDGGERLLLGGDDFLRGGIRWSRDGSGLTYNRRRLAGLDPRRVDHGLVTFSTNTGEEQTLTTPGTANETPWDWSADGKWILAGTDRRTPGRMSLCLFPTSAAPKAETELKLLTSHPEQNIDQARFSPDNRWISFIAAQALEAGRSTIYAIPAGGGAWVRITEGKYFDDKPRWSPDGRKLYFISNRTGFFNVWSIGIDPTTAQPVGEPVRLTSYESPAQMILPDVRIMEMALSQNRLILPIMEVSGGIWVLENIDR